MPRRQLLPKFRNLLTICQHSSRVPTWCFARPGASPVAEIAAAGKPAIFVPFLLAADDHQRRNAEALEKAQAAVVLEETRLDEVWLVDTICALLEDSARLTKMGEAAGAMAHPDAARDIAELAAKVGGSTSH